MSTIKLPETGYIRLSQIVGNPKKNIPPLIPVCASTWWAGVKAGRFPPAVKLGPRTTCWKIEHVKALIENPDAVLVGGK